MNLTLTNSSRKSLKNIQDRMIEQFEKHNTNKYKLKFTKKKEFIAVPFSFNHPAFQLFVNGKFHKTYFLINKVWKEM
jgi:hypothetical protein